MTDSEQTIMDMMKQPYRSSSASAIAKQRVREALERHGASGVRFWADNNVQKGRSPERLGLDVSFRLKGSGCDVRRWKGGIILDQDYEGWAKHEDITNLLANPINA